MILAHHLRHAGISITGGGQDRCVFRNAARATTLRASRIYLCYCMQCRFGHGFGVPISALDAKLAGS